MDLSSPAKKVASVASIGLILFWVVFFGYKFSQRGKLPEQPYLTEATDYNVGWVAAMEAERVANGNANAVVLLNAHENPRGTAEETAWPTWKRLSKAHENLRATADEKAARANLLGFSMGQYDDTGKPQPNFVILGKKYKSDDRDRDPYRGWPTLSILQGLAGEFPNCNVVVSFCGLPDLAPKAGSAYDPAKLPRMVVVNQYPDGPERWQATLRSGMVAVLINRHAPTPTTKALNTPREIVALEYWIITPENLAEILRKAGG